MTKQQLVVVFAVWLTIATQSTPKYSAVLAVT